MSERKTSLRVFYTINSAPQYILARSLSPVSVVPISQEEQSLVRSTVVLYASVALKTCLDAICRSSPDLTHDSTRDFSLYVLDPLESNSAPAPVNISNARADTAGSTSSMITEKPRPVAVGLGLMSWALASSDGDSISVTGTLMKQPNGQEALEVIFALRETVATKQRAWDMSSSLQAPSSSRDSVTTEPPKLPQYSTSQESYFAHQTSSSTTLSRSASSPDLTRETVASIQARTKAKVKAPKQARYSNTPMTESDKLMNAADTYIGPLKKKGRPKTTNAESRAKNYGRYLASTQASAQKEVIVLDTSDNENNAFSSRASDAGAKKKRASQQPRPPPFTTAPLTRQQTVADLQVRTENCGVTGFNPLSLLSALSVDSTISNAALLTVLATIDSTKTQENPTLIAALKQLLANCTLPPQPATAIPTTTAAGHAPSSAQCDSVIILDKENVNPTTSRKCPGKNGLDKLSDPLPFVLNSSKERALQSLRPSTRTNETGSINTPKETSVPAVRKRTLSDVADGKESGRKKGKGRETLKKRDLHRDSSLQCSEMPSDAMRHYPQVFAANLPRLGQPSNYYRTPSDPSTSPVRGRADNAANKQLPGVEGSGSHSSKHFSPRNRQRVSASSPIRPKAPKKYVVPEWARTDTATRPRLSEEAKRAVEEAEARKREERNAARRKLSAKVTSCDPINAPDAEPHKPAEQPSRPQFVSAAKKSDLSQGPIAASGGGPVIAFPLVSTIRPSSPPLLPSANLHPQTPKTPATSRLPYNCGEEDGSLFTPMTGSLFGSAVSRRSHHGTPPSVLTSPLGNRKKAKVSSTQPAFSGSGINPLHAWSSSTDSIVSEEHERSSNLSKESEEALDDLDCPPNSLPIASSDIDVDFYSQSTGDAGGQVDDSGEQTVKQHWAGLPPSSPPPPSSPMLVPETRTDDEDMDELPIATSDSEMDADMNAFDTNGPSPDTVGTSETEPTQTPMNLTDEDFTALFSMENNPSSSLFQLSSSTTLDLFEQYTNVNVQSDDISALCGSSPTNTDIQTMFQNGVDNLDFTEFWETFKPMVSENSPPSQEVNVEQSFAEFFGMANTQLLQGDVPIDHGKLADNMQSLFSGCLV